LIHRDRKRGRPASIQSALRALSTFSWVERGQLIDWWMAVSLRSRLIPAAKMDVLVCGSQEAASSRVRTMKSSRLMPPAAASERAAR